MKEKIEKRFINNPELRIAKDGDSFKISGYAAVFNSDSEDMGFVERIKPGAFKNALKKSDVRALINHDPNEIVGRTGSNLTLTEDKNGLFMELEKPFCASRRFDQLISDIESGLITQQSFGFTVEKDEWDKLDTDHPIRTIVAIDQLYDVSPVVYAAYADTSVALRSLAEARNQNPNKSEEVTIVIDGAEHVFNRHEEFDLIVEKMNELRKNDTSLSTAVLWEKKAANPKIPVADNEIVDESLNRLRKIERKYNKL